MYSYATQFHQQPLTPRPPPQLPRPNTPPPPGADHRRPQVRHAGAPRDAVPAPHGAEGVGRGALLRPRRKLRAGPRLVPEQDAAQLQGTDHY